MTERNTVKTTVCMERRTFEKAEALRGLLGVTRSRLFELAVEEVATRYENRMLLDRMNAAYGERAA